MSVDRIEAQFTVPAGTQISVANGGQTAAQTITIGAGTYYMGTLLSTIQQQLNDNVQGYPQSAALMAAVAGGTWTSGAGYLLNDASGNPASVFGSPANLTATTLTYGNTGPRGGIDKAIGFSATSSKMDGGNVFDVTTTDLIIKGCCFITSVGSLDRDMIFKRASAGTAGYGFYKGISGNLNFFLTDSTPTTANCSVAYPIGTWFAFMLVVDRSVNQIRLGVCPLGGSATVSGTGNIAGFASSTNAGSFVVGGDGAIGTGNGADTGMLLSSLYAVSGSGVATGLSAGLSTAVKAFADAINASWSVTPASSSDGRTLISYSSPPAGVSSYSIDFTSTTLRDLLGFTRNINYPTTAAEVLAQLGYATWNAGWLCNEASGNIVPAFGSPTMTPTSTPTYGTPGPRGGPDKAIGIDSASDGFLGGDVYDVAATEDHAFLAVCYFPAAPNSGVIFRKGVAADASYWVIYTTGAGGITLEWKTTSGTKTATSSSLPIGSWFVLSATFDRTTNRLRIGTCPLGGSPTVSTETTGFAEAVANASDFAFGSGAGFGSLNVPFYCSAFFIAVGAGAASGLSANLSSALSNFAATFGPQTSTKQAKGVWYPTYQIDVDNGLGDPKQAPKGDDGIATLGPTGTIYGISANTWFHHRNLAYRMLPKNKVWSADALFVNEDYETWYLDTQRKQHAWFAGFSPVKIYWDNAGVATQLGNGVVSSWRLPAPKRLDEIRNSNQNFTGLVDVELGDAYSSG